MEPESKLIMLLTKSTLAKEGVPPGTSCSKFRMEEIRERIKRRLRDARDGFDLSSRVYSTPNLFSQEECDELVKELESQVPFSQGSVLMNGVSVLEPRLTCWQSMDPSRPYNYSGKVIQPVPLSPCVLRIKQRVDLHLGQCFDNVLINRYKDGGDHIGWHSDKESVIEGESIVSVSFGATRRFEMRLKSTPEVRWSYLLCAGSLVHMKGDCQKTLEHCIVKDPKVVQVRYNLTFRRLKNI